MLYFYIVKFILYGLARVGALLPKTGVDPDAQRNAVSKFVK